MQPTSGITNRSPSLPVAWFMRLAGMKMNRRSGRQETSEAGARSLNRLAVTGLLVLLLAVAGLAGFVLRSTSKPPTPIQKLSASKSVRTLSALVALKPEELEGTDIALMNLLCAE